MNCLAPVGDFFVGLTRFLNTQLGIAQDLIWILCTWIVRSEDHHVTQRAGGLAHRRTFAAIAIAATAKHGDNPSLRYVSRRAQDIQQRVVAMRVVDYHGKVSIMNHAFKASRRAGTFFQRRRNYVETVTKRQSTGYGRKRVVNVRRANQRRMKIAFPRRSPQLKLHARQGKLWIMRSDISV